MARLPVVRNFLRRMKVFFRVPNSRTPNPIFVNRARSSKRAGGLIPRIALDQCRVPERYRTRAPFRTPEREVDRAAQPFHFFIEILESAGCESVEETGQGFFLSTEYWSTGALECCKVLRVIHITPLLHYSSTTVSYRGCGLTAECGHAKAETTVQFRSPAPFLSLWCSPDNMPASHAGYHRSEAGQGRQFSARGSRGTADPPDSESGSLGRASRLAPTSSPSKHCQRCVRSVSESARCDSE